MQAYEGYFEDGRFYPVGSITSKPGRIKAFIILDEQIEPSKPSQRPKDDERFWIKFHHQAEEVKTQNRKLRADWIKKMDEAVDLSLNEELPDFSRSTTMREPICMTDEE